MPLTTSIAMTTYNGEKYLQEQLDSFCIQTVLPGELVVVDDCSNDKTIDILTKFKEKAPFPVKIIQNTQNIGSKHQFAYSKNFDTAIRNCNNDIVFLSDQDDIWMPTKVEELVKLLKIYDCVVSDAVVVDKNKNVISTSFMELNNSKSGLINNIIKNGFLGCCMAFNRKILDRALPFPVPIPMHDTWIGLIAEKYGKTYFIRKPLICYRRHGENASPTAEKSRYSLLRKLWNRWLFLKNIILR